METDTKLINAPSDWLIGTTFSAGRPPSELQEVKRSGIDCIELNLHSFDLTDPEVRERCGTLITAAEQFGIKVWSVHIPFGPEWDPSSPDQGIREQVVLKVGEVLKFASERGIRTAVFHPSWEPIQPEERMQRLDNCRWTLTRLVPFSSETGVRLAVECLPRTCLGHSADEMISLIHDIPELGVCCDVNHLFHEPPEKFIDRLGSRIITTHISDNDGNDEKHWLPKSGVIHWQAVIDSLTGIGYRGAFLYEARASEPEQIVRNYHSLFLQEDC